MWQSPKHKSPREKTQVEIYATVPQALEKSAYAQCATGMDDEINSLGMSLLRHTSKTGVEWYARNEESGQDSLSTREDYSTHLHKHMSLSDLPFEVVRDVPHSCFLKGPTHLALGHVRVTPRSNSFTPRVGLGSLLDASRHEL